MVAIDFPSAPTNGMEVTLAGMAYIWNGQIWTVKPAAGGGGLTDAPADGTIYGRQDNLWAAIGGSVELGSFGDVLGNNSMTPVVGTVHQFVATSKRTAINLWGLIAKGTSSVSATAELNLILDGVILSGSWSGTLFDLGFGTAIAQPIVDTVPGQTHSISVQMLVSATASSWVDATTTIGVNAL